jgi:hypothetical protein
VEVRHRLLPARVVVYYVLGLALFSQASYEEVMRELVEGLSWASGWAQSWQVPTKAALFKARARLGPEPLRVLFEAAAVPLATAETKGAWYRDWRLMSIDGTCIDVADTPANEAEFGRPGSARGGTGAFPQARLAGLAECGTHALVAAAVGACTTGETTLARGLLGSLRPGMLVLADRNFYGFELWNAARATGAELLWRTKAGHVLRPHEQLPDGSWLARLRRFSNYHMRGTDVVVRVIDYAAADPGRPQAEDRYRLLTTITDPHAAPAAELAALYPQRWEFETALDELKTHQRGPRTVLRSKMPDGVRQEIYGYLCVHYAIRWLMHTVALKAGADPDRLSFTRTLRAARRTTRSHPGFPPSGAG